MLFSEKTEVMAYCNNGHPVGIYKNIDEMRRQIFLMKKCPDPECDVKFEFWSDGRIWNLRYEIVKASEENYSNASNAVKDVESDFYEANNNNTKTSNSSFVIIQGGTNSLNVMNAINSKVELRQNMV